MKWVTASVSTNWGSKSAQFGVTGSKADRMAGPRKIIPVEILILVLYRYQAIGNGNWKPKMV